MEGYKYKELGFPYSLSSNMIKEIRDKKKKTLHEDDSRAISKTRRVGR